MKNSASSRHGIWRIVLLAVGLTTILLALGGALYWRSYTRSPEYSLKQAREAMERHDWSEFQKYVEVESVATNLADGIALQYGGGAGLDVFAKEALRDVVEGKRTPESESSGIAEGLKGINAASVSEVTHLDGEALAEVRFRGKKLELRMESVGDHWRVISVENVEDLVGEVVEEPAPFPEDEAEPPSAETTLNPVDLVKKAGATPPPGAKKGEQDFNGQWYADGRFPTDPGNKEVGAYTEITVWVYNSREELDAEMAAPDAPESADDSVVMVGKTEAFLAIMTGVMDLETGGTNFDVEPDVVAGRLGAEVLP